MSAAVLDAVVAGVSPREPLRDLRVTPVRVLRSEWTKFRSVRSTGWTLLLAVILTIGIGAAFAAITASQFHSFSPSAKASFNAINTSLNGVTFAQLAIGVLGVLVMSGEYSTGMIRSTMTVVPSRLPVLWAKLVVFAGAVFPIMLVASFSSFLLGQYLLDGKDLGVSITSAGALRSVVGAAAYVTLAGMIGLTLGSLLRNTAAGISTFVGVFFVFPPLLGLLPSSVSDHFVQYLPSNAGASLFSKTMGVHDPLSPTGGLLVLIAYVVVLAAVAAWRLRRTDA